MNLFRIENITLKPLFVFAHDPDDAADILGHMFINGLSHRPDADFDVVPTKPERTDHPKATLRWLADGYRGMLWTVEEGASAEFVPTLLIDPKDLGD